MDDIRVIIPAAGHGTRMGGDTPKLLLEIAGKTVIERTLEKFAGQNFQIVLVTNEELKSTMQEITKQKFPMENITVITGGSSRTESVRNGFRSLENLSPQTKILIHDGARCLISNEEIDAVIDTLNSCECCTVATPLKNTIKKIRKIEDKTTVEETPNRADFMEVQTPQGFIADAFSKCAESQIEATDDTAIAEQLGMEVVLVPGKYSNIKITTPEDVFFADAIIKQESLRSE